MENFIFFVYKNLMRQFFKSLWQQQPFTEIRQIIEK